MSTDRDPDQRRTTTFDPLATITGLVLSPFRLPPAARPLMGRKERKTLRLRKRADSGGGAARAGAGIGQLPAGIADHAGAPSAGPQQKQKLAWDRASQKIRAGIPGTPDGGPPAPERGTAMLMQEPGFERVDDAKRRARGARRTPRKRQLVEIGIYLRRYGRLRGLLLAVLLALVVFLPALLPASVVPDGVTRETPPWFLVGPLAEHYALGSLVAIGVVALGSLILPGILRGLVLVAIGFAPFVAYALAHWQLVPGWTAPAVPAGLEGHTTLVLLLFPAWVAMGAGMVAGQNFPDARPGRVLAGLGAIVVLGQQIIGSGVLRQTVETRVVAMEGLIALLIFAMTLTAIGQMLKGSMAVAISFAKAGLILLVALPLLLALWQFAGGEDQKLPSDLWFQAFRSLLMLEVCLLLAVVGVAEWLHRLAWRREVKAKLGHRYARMNPATQEFGQQFIEYVHHSGIYAPEEMAVIRNQLQQRLRAARRAR